VQSVVNLQANGAVVATPTPFPGFNGEVRRATADFDKDGTADVVWSAGPGAGPAVLVVSGATGPTLASLFAFGPGFAGGVFAAAGEGNGAGTPDLVVGAGAGAGPNVEVIDGTKLTQTQGNGQISNSALLTSFFAFSPVFAGGVTVAAGDV